MNPAIEREDDLPSEIAEMAARGIRVHAAAWATRIQFARDDLERKIREARERREADPQSSDRLRSLKSYGPEIDRQLVESPDGRVRAEWSRRPAGRFYASGPTLQQITKLYGLRDAVVPEDGHSFLDADWSSAHLLIAAGLSGDEALYEALREGRAYENAAEVLVPEVEASVQRRAAKIAVLSTLNQGGGTNLSGLLAEFGHVVDAVSAKRRIVAWLDLYPDLRAYLSDLPGQWKLPLSGRTVVGPSGRERASWVWQSHEGEMLVRAMSLVRWPVVLAMHDGMLLEVPSADVEQATHEVLAAMDQALVEVARLSLDGASAKIETRPSWGGGLVAETVAPPRPEFALPAFLTLEPTEAPNDKPHTMTPDGRPYAVWLEGAPGYFFALRGGGFAFARAELLVVELERQWPNLVLTLPKLDGEGRRVMTPVEAAKAHGRRAERVFYSYMGSTRYVYGDNDGGELFIRVAAPAGVRSVRHPEVVEWLELAFAPKVLDWLATLHRLDLPTCALLLLGKSGIGKSMIAHGAARYFGAAVSDYDDVFKGRFNDALLRSPVVFLDETTEVDARSGGFRRMLGNSAHPVEGKNRPTATLLGCPRLVVASNNPDPLKLGREDLTRADEEAIGARILVVDCDSEAAKWLDQRGGRAFTSDWVERPDGTPGKLVETIAWLIANRTVARGGRWLVAGDASDWAARVATRTGLPATILDAIRLYLDLDSVSREQLGAEPFRWHTDHPDVVLVSNSELREVWLKLMGNSERVPSHRKVTEALATLSGSDKPIRLGRSGPRVFPVPESLVPEDE